jgi:hypothetical protein
MKTRLLAASRVGEKKFLKSPFTALENEHLLQEAEPLSIIFRGVYANRPPKQKFEEWWERFALTHRIDINFGEKIKNNLMVASTYQYSLEPIVQRVHFLRDKMLFGWQGNFFDNIVYSTQDLKDKDIKLEIQIYDIHNISDDIFKLVDKFAQTSAVLFPVSAPYIAVADGLGKAVLELTDNLDKHLPIIDENLILKIADPNDGHCLLQTGYFVCFNHDIDLKDCENFYLGNDLKVYDKEDKEIIANKQYQDYSYAVLEIEKDFEEDPKREIDQKVAKLLSQLHGKGTGTEDAFTFLTKTFETYDKLKKIERYNELKGKLNKTDAENQLLDKLKENPDINDFISK